MSYIIEPMSLITFLEESKLKLPRFQRKATWDKKQNFELAISIFQDYPVGVVIINQEQNASWLLDGRQRRNALMIMRDNPVELYKWALSYIGFNKTADELELTQAYWNKVEKYLQTESAPDEKKEDINQYDDTEPEIDNSENSFDSTRQREGLNALLDIILMVHQIKSSGSKWEKTFDFGKYFKRLKYAPEKNEKKVDPILLRRFILEFIKFIDKDCDGNLTKENFMEFYKQNFDIQEQEEFEKDVDKKWENITKSINVIAKSEKIFTDARIGVIRLTNATPLDAQNIFSRINKGGTQLKAEELLSAKPFWNKEVNITDFQIKKRIEEMYNRLGIPNPNTVVRWDIAATLISRIKDNNLIFDTYEESKDKKEVSMDEISLGFKLLSAVYVGGMSNKQVLELEKLDKVNWNEDIEELVGGINLVCKILLKDEFFKYLQSWKLPITKLLGNAIALEFITVLFKDWVEHEKPGNFDSSETRALQRDARVLLDRLIFEYATKTWRGSGDSKMSADIKNWNERLIPVENKDWNNFIDGACVGRYNGWDTTPKLLRPVLYYYYVLTKCTPINQVDVSFDVDHIFPQESFKYNQTINKSLENSLINLALLPKKENISKKDKALNEINDTWLKLQITTYTGINQEDFEKYSDLSNLELLQKDRKELFVIAFNTNRESNLKN